MIMMNGLKKSMKGCLNSTTKFKTILNKKSDKNDHRS